MVFKIYYMYIPIATDLIQKNVLTMYTVRYSKRLNSGRSANHKHRFMYPSWVYLMQMSSQNSMARDRSEQWDYLAD